MSKHVQIIPLVCTLSRAYKIIFTIVVTIAIFQPKKYSRTLCKNGLIKNSSAVIDVMLHS